MADEALIGPAAAPLCDREVHVHLTSFGPFLNVAVNPSSAVMRHLAALLHSRVCVVGDGDASTWYRLVVRTADVLHVTPAAVQQRLDRYATEQVVDPLAAAVCRVMIHLGVHRGGTSIKFERVAINNLHCPLGDADGISCTNERIATTPPLTPLPGPQTAASSMRPISLSTADGDAPTEATSECEEVAAPVTWCPEDRTWLTHNVAGFIAATRRRFARIAAVSHDAAPVSVSGARQEQGSAVLGSSIVAVRDSVDAGAYLCNYTLYQSLRLLSWPPALRSREARRLETIAATQSTISVQAGGVSPVQQAVAGSDDEDAGGDAALPTLPLFVHVTDPSAAITAAHTAELQAELIAWNLIAFLDRALAP